MGVFTLLEMLIEIYLQRRQRGVNFLVNQFWQLQRNCSHKLQKTFFHSDTTKLARVIIVQKSGDKKERYAAKVKARRQEFFKKFIFHRLEAVTKRIAAEKRSGQVVDGEEDVDDKQLSELGQFVAGSLFDGQTAKRLSKSIIVTPKEQESAQSQEDSGNPLKRLQRTREESLANKKHRKMVGTIIKGCKGVLEMEMVLKANEAYQEQIHFACALNRLAKMPQSPDKERVVDYVIQRSQPYVQFYKDPALAQIVWALGKMRHHPPQQYTAKLMQALQRRAPNFLPRGYSTVFYGLANLGIMNAKVLDTLSSEMVKSLHYFSAQNLANTAWACATLRYENYDLFTKLASVAMERLSEFEQQQLSQLAWAFAKLDHYDKKLFEVMAARVRLRQHYLSPQAISNVGWAFAKMGHGDHYLFYKLGQQAFAKLPEFTGQGITVLAWSFGKTKNYSPKLFDRIAAVVISRPTIFSSRDLANLSWAFAAVRHYRPALFDALAKQLVPVLYELTPEGIIQISESFAYFNHNNDVLFNEIMSQSASLHSKAFDEKYTIRLMWSMAVMGKKNQQWWKHIIKQCQNWNMSNIDDKWLVALQQTHLICQAQDNLCFDINRLSKDLVEGACYTWLNVKHTTTQFQEDVFQLLKEMNLHPQMKTWTEDGMIHVDLMINLEGQLIAIQTESEQCYTLSQPRVPLIYKYINDQLLEYRKWTVVTIPFFEWAEQTTNQSKERYLAKKIERARDSNLMLALGGQ